MIQSFRNTGPRLTAERLMQFERDIAKRLPDSYRNFLLATNGGVPVPCFFPIQNMPKNPFGALSNFYGIGRNENYMDLATRMSWLGARCPEGCIPIADTPTGDEVVLRIDRGDPCSVWYLDHDDIDVETGERLKYAIAEDLESFVKAFHDHTTV